MHRAFNAAVIILLSAALISTVCLYSYPIVLGCSFPLTTSNQPAPFRLLALGDPQLEGDSSLPSSHDGFFSGLRKIYDDPETSDASTRQRLSLAQTELKNLFLDAPLLLRLLRKKLDLFGNDYYLAHIYRTLHKSLDPTHVTVLGDLIGSQWVSDEEFAHRGHRYWNRVFSNGQRVEDEITQGQWRNTLEANSAWKRRIINVAGNHDIGYAGDMSEDRMNRFESMYGKANWDTVFTLPSTKTAMGEHPELRLIILNTLNLDTPALSYELQKETYDFINAAISTSQPVEDTTHATILLTHLPFHKDEGVCVDPPMIAYYEQEHGGGVREQNHLSYDASKTILESIYGKSGNPDAAAGGMGRNGVILTGHDHEGCDVYHHLPQAETPEDRRWSAEKWNRTSQENWAGVPGLREITVRSMMGEFGGNAGLLSGWFDEEKQSWNFEYDTCKLGVQHIWWAVHVFDVVTVGFLLSTGAMYFKARRGGSEAVKEKTN